MYAEDAKLYDDACQVLRLVGRVSARNALLIDLNNKRQYKLVTQKAGSVFIPALQVQQEPDEAIDSPRLQRSAV